MAGYIDDATLRAAADGIVRPSSTNPQYSAWYVAAITRSNNRAFGIIRRSLASRGYSPTQITNWSDGVEFQTDLGLFYLCLEARNDLTPQAMAMLDNYDRRQELSFVEFTDAAGNVIPPDNSGTGNPVGSGQIQGIPNACPPCGAFPGAQQWANGYGGSCGGGNNQGESCPGNN